MHSAIEEASFNWKSKLSQYTFENSILSKECKKDTKITYINDIYCE